MFQINSGSLEGKFGWKVKERSKILVRHNVYNFIGSDAHNNRRTIGIKNGLEIINKINNEFLENYNIDSEKLINDEVINFKGEKLKKKKYFFI